VPRQYLETYLDSDATGRVPLNPEQLQDVLEAAFDRDGTAARNYLEELNGERGPMNLGDSTLQIVTRRGEGKDTGYELLFDPTDSQDLKHLIEQLDIRAWEKQNAQTTPGLETKPISNDARPLYLSRLTSPEAGPSNSRQNYGYRCP